MCNIAGYVGAREAAPILIEMIRALEYGQLTITVKGSKPIHVEEVRKSIPLK